MAKKILVLDDSKTVCQQVNLVLGRTGEYQVITADDGFQGLAKLKEHPDVSMILTDVNMPNMNGLEFMEELRKDDKFKNIPVFVVTTETDKDFMERAKKAGAKGWLVKPFQPDILKQAVKACVG